MSSPLVPVATLVAAVLMMLGHLEHLGMNRRREFGERTGLRRDRATRDGSRAFVNRTLSRATGLLPDGWERAERNRLVRAGLEIEGDTYLTLRLMAGLVGATLAFAVALTNRRTLPVGPTGAIGCAVGLFGIDWWVERRARANADLLRGAWPHFLHRLRLCLLAGLSLERALATLAGDPGVGRGRVFGGQLENVVREIRAGVSCEGALAKWGELTQAEDVLALSVAAESSRALGLPLAASLAKQAAMARDRLRQQHLGWVTSLPSRLSLCAMLFFLPAILIIVLVPSVLSFIRSGW